MVKLQLCVLFLIFTLISCNEKKNKNVKIDQIENAISLIKKTKAINDTLTKYHNTLDVDFLPCYIRETKTHNILTFVVMFSKNEKSFPIRYENRHQIEKIKNIDVLFITNNHEIAKKYTPPIIDVKTQKLIDKGYLTIEDRISSNHSYFVSFVFCKENDRKFKALNLDFLANEEMKMINLKKPFLMENYYPKCD